MSTQLKERPIILTVDEVNAVLAGDKTQHRAPVLTSEQLKEGFEWDFGADGDSAIFIKKIDDERQEVLLKPCPFGAEGDQLWVQEFHAHREFADPLIGTHYYADGPLTLDLRHDAGLLIKYAAENMPRWASRTLLEVNDIRIERVQDTSHADAVAEGVHHFDIEARLRDQPLSVAQIVFSRHWDTKHQDRDTHWESNPWVWVIEFKKVDD